jgi:hypothetical protein
MDNVKLLTDLLTLGAPIVLGFSAAAYLVLLLFWQRTPGATKSTTSGFRR